MELKKSVLLILVIILIGLVFFSASNFINENLIVGQAGLRGTCYDSDGGREGSEFVAASVSGVFDNGVEYERDDYCVTAYALKEYYCDTSTSTNFAWGSTAIGGDNFIQCKKGCRDGACIR